MSTPTGYSICGHKKLRTLSDVHVAGCHNDRTLPPTHAKVGQDTTPELLAGAPDHKALVQLQRSKVAALKRKPRAGQVAAVEINLTASPEYFDPDGTGKWRPDRVAAFKAAAMKFIAAEYGDNLLQAMLHLDETSPHVHVIALPVLDGVMSCKRYTAKRRLVEVHDRWASATQHLGLVRGRRNSGVSHTALKDFYKAVTDPLPPAPVMPKRPTVTAIEKLTGAAADKVESYNKALKQYRKDLKVYVAVLEAKARYADRVLGDDKERALALAQAEQRLRDERDKFELMRVQWESRRDLDDRGKLNIIKALPREWLATVLGVPLPGKADPVDVLRRAGIVKNMSEGVSYIFDHLHAYGARLAQADAGVGALPAPVTNAGEPLPAPSVANGTPDHVISL